MQPRRTTTHAGDLLAFGLDDFFTPVKTIGADVMAQMYFARGRLKRQRCYAQRMVCPVHAALGGGFLILLNCHGMTPSM
jgi:hypothetical protein